MRLGDSAERQISNNFLTIHIGGRVAESANRLDVGMEYAPKKTPHIPKWRSSTNYSPKEG